MEPPSRRMQPLQGALPSEAVRSALIGCHICPQRLLHLPSEAVRSALRGCYICPQRLSDLPQRLLGLPSEAVRSAFRGCQICPQRLSDHAPTNPRPDHGCMTCRPGSMWQMRSLQQGCRAWLTSWPGCRGLQHMLQNKTPSICRACETMNPT